MIIKKLELQNNSLVRELFELQKASYLVEANLIHFFEIPPLVETIDDLRNCEETFFGYFEDDILAGAISFTIEGEEMKICRLVVHPKHFKKGIAQKLLAIIEENDPKITVYKVSTGKDNLPAKNLYLKNGYRLINEVEAAPGLFLSNFKKSRSPAL
ncbi:GNAT family N-acetyltransferase [Neobacillus mesonae]|uniref:GNAT family N-acetyltransferase n=1 Tax=Neobacillus mesonae TaxID=1193713 RepID=UPI00203F567F|nr:GNAT family N-acetyltransferase [Neobacillus mesonae]MCM3567990.1 GNAT family N-acetyltransferase [Neobacillus mesonae]